ncbi:hypothetical protein QTP86_031543 [Hemibagrus guttatus]|nr:hypothetical protein QTP86_031543 [Hemibagrus guttatus]
MNFCSSCDGKSCIACRNELEARRMDPATSASGGPPQQITLPITDPAELRDIIVRQGAIIRSFQDQVTALQAQLRFILIHHLHAPGMYREEGTKFAFLLSLMMDRALEWASALWDTDPQVKSSFAYFAGMIREVFEYSTGDKDISLQLMELRQGSETAADYAIRFRTLAAQSGWNDAALWAVFRAGLNPGLQAELACHTEATQLTQWLRPSDWTICGANTTQGPKPLLTPEFARITLHIGRRRLSPCN